MLSSANLDTMVCQKRGDLKKIVPLGLIVFIGTFQLWKLNKANTGVVSVKFPIDCMPPGTVQLHHQNDTDLSGFDVGKAKLKYLPQFKNPCWLEPYTDEKVYKKNFFFTKDYPKVARSSRLKDLPQQGVPFEDASICANTAGKGRLRCLPYFMLLGVHKSGSTDFYQRTDNHPHIFSGIKKEIYWWNQLRFDTLLGASLGNYADLFDLSANKIKNYKVEDPTSGEIYYPSVVGEYTAMTFFDMSYWRTHPRNQGLREPKVTTPHDVYAVNPNMKLMVILRNPTSRLYSHYNFFNPSSQCSPEDFHKHVLGSIEWWKNCTETKGLPRRNCAYGSPPEMPRVYDKLGKPPMWWNLKKWNYSGEIRTGLYAIHAKEWLSVFPRENMLFIQMEEYSADVTKTYKNEVYPFLGVDPPSDEVLEAIDVKLPSLKKHYKPILSSTKAVLDEFYRPFNEELAELLGDEKWLWKT